MVHAYSLCCGQGIRLVVFIDKYFFNPISKLYNYTVCTLEAWKYFSCLYLLNLYFSIFCVTYFLRTLKRVRFSKKINFPIVSHSIFYFPSLDMHACMGKGNIINLWERKELGKESLHSTEESSFFIIHSTVCT